MQVRPGYILEHCRKNCLKSARDWSLLHEQLEKLLKDRDIASLLSQKFPIIHHHHLPKVTIAGCPNGCSQPQIKDIGLSGYLRPEFTDSPCNGCQACINVCQEGALTWQDNPVLASEKCIGCGDCIRSCQTGRIVSGESGWTLHLGGRLGRHPQLAKIASEKLQDPDVLVKINQIIEDYKENSLPQERLTHFLARRNF